MINCLESGLIWTNIAFIRGGPPSQTPGILPRKKLLSEFSGRVQYPLSKNCQLPTTLYYMMYSNTWVRFPIWVKKWLLELSGLRGGQGEGFTLNCALFGDPPIGDFKLENVMKADY